MKLLLCCHLPAKDRTEPALAWKASVQYGPVVYGTTKRMALRRAVEAWLTVPGGRPPSTFQVNIVLKTELTIRQLTQPRAMDFMNRDTGMLSLRKVDDEP